MANRTYAVGDIHGDIVALQTVLARLPSLDRFDTIVFMGDYVDRGPRSAQVIEFIRHELPTRTEADIIRLMGNHEEAWLRIIDGKPAHFVVKATNGCLATLRSFQDLPVTNGDPTSEDFELMVGGAFLPPDVVQWMRKLRRWYEDEHAIYVHAGLRMEGDRWLHPRESADHPRFLWDRPKEFYRSYQGKPVVVGHTPRKYIDGIRQELAEDAESDGLGGNDCVHMIDTGSGQGGYLSILELPALRVYDSRPDTP